APDRSPLERLRKLRRRTSVRAVVALAALLLAGLGVLLAAETQQRRHLQARQALHALDADLERIPYLLASADSAVAQRAEGLALCRRHAEVFDVLGPPGWAERGPASRLAPDERERLVGGMGEVLWLWARGLGWSARVDEALDV